MYNEGDNHIDELFRSALKGHEETPPASAWNNIAETRSFGHILLNQIALNWKNFLFMTIGFMFVGAAIVGYGTDSKKEVTAFESSNTHYEVYGGHDFGGMLLAYNSPEGNVTKNGSSSYYGNAMGRSFESFSSISKMINLTPNSTYKKQTNTYYTNKSVGPFNSKNEESQQNIVDTKNDEELNTDKNIAVVTYKNVGREQLAKNDENTYKAPALPAKKKLKVAGRQVPNNVVFSVEENTALTEKSIRLLGFVPSLKTHKINKVSRSKAAEPIMVDSLYFNKTMKKQFSLKNHVYASFKFGPEFMIKELTNSSSENGAYLNKRNQSETSLIGGNVQANLTYYFYNNVFVETGFRYSQLRERISYTQSEVIGERTVYDSTLTGYIVGPTGDPIPIYDITSRTEIDKKVSNREQTNTYQMIDVPILLGYQVDLQRWSIYFKSGINATVYAKNKGLVLGASENSSLEFDSDNDPYQSGIMLNLEVAGGISYQLDENISFLLEPSFRSNMSNFYKGDYPLIEKRKIIGINTGIRIKL